MNNADMTIVPSILDTQDSMSENSGGRYVTCNGLTKREQFCLTMGVAETGDEELDAIIRKGNEQKFAGLAMQGLVAAQDQDGTWAHDSETVAKTAVEYAKTLLQQLEGGKDE